MEVLPANGGTLQRANGSLDSVFFFFGFFFSKIDSDY